MKRLIIMLLLLAFLAGCATGKPVREISDETLAAGTREIKKGVAWYQKGCYERAMENFFKAHELFSASDQLNGVAQSLNNIGNVYRISGDTSSAVLFFEESYGLFADMDNDPGTLSALSNKAAALIDGEKLTEAEKALNIAAGLVKKTPGPFVPLLNNWGVLYTKKKDYLRAEETLNAALAHTDPLNFSESASVNFAMGNLMLEKERFQQAADHFQTALAADKSAGFHKGIADDLAAMGATNLRQDRTAPAVKFFKRAVKIYALIGNTGKVREIMARLDQVSGKAGVDIQVIRHFVKNWQEGKILVAPCN
ncbi:MAG: tetratricopeptide repeat protein [Desulfobacterales bacterium]|nr:tetratricopeptide repeat protein [Desulfobacterales bacterium]